MNIDYVIRKDEPPAITDESSPADVALYEQWEWSNRLSVMFIKTKISTGIRGFVYQHEKVWDFLKVIDDQFITSYKALASSLIMKFSSLRLTSVKGVREYTMQMQDILTQLKKLKVDMSDSSWCTSFWTLFHRNMVRLRFLTTHIRANGLSMNESVLT